MSHFLFYILSWEFVALGVHIHLKLMDYFLCLSLLLYCLIYLFLHYQEILLLLQLPLTTFQPFVLILNDFQSSCSTFQLFLQYSHLVIWISIVLYWLVLEKNHIFIDKFIQLIIEPPNHISNLLIKFCQAVNGQLT